VAFGTITVGRLVLREANSPVSEDASGSLSLSGQEAASTTTGRFPLDRDGLAALQADIRGLAGTLVPVRFTDKHGLDGYYTVTSSSAELSDWQGEVITCGWQIGLARVGSASEVDIESRLAGPLTRVNDHTVTGERWHAPPIGHSAYWAGSTTPSTMTRATSDGTLVVYRGVPVATSTRYACPVDTYLAGRVRITDAGRERSGARWDMSPLGWSLDNGIAQVTVAADALSIAAWDSGAWVAKSWNVLFNAAALGAPDVATVLRNDLECCTVRLLWSLAVGRVTCDLTLRRGARVVELFVRTSTSGVIKVARSSSEAATSATGYIRATSDDAAGNRYVCGSARSFTPDVGVGGISKASATSLDAFVCVELGGSSAVSGDQAANLLAQYLGSPAERVSAARR
jgi:hypothetical protein